MVNRRLKVNPRLLSLVFLLAFFFDVFAQTESIIPPSPQSKLFEKYVDYPVTLYNGVPEINIPLYEINLDGAKVPVSLSYHASGIKHNQFNGDIGVGWVLMPGYRINRTVYGKVDEQYNKPANIESAIQSKSLGLDRDEYLASYVWDYIDMYTPDPDGFYDGEFDQFRFSGVSGRGSFIITDRSAKTVEILERTNDKIEYTLDGDMISRIDLTDANGFKHYYGKSVDGSQKSYEKHVQAYTGWPLMNIVSPLGRRADFKYLTNLEHHKDVHPSMFVYNERIDHSLSGVPDKHQYGTFSESNYSDTTAFLDEIRTDNEVIKILRGGIGTLEYYHVRSIEIYSTISNALIRRINFYKSQKGPHVMLDSIKIEGTGGVRQIYRFEYYNTSMNANMDNYIADQWGYYKSYPGFTTATNLYDNEASTGAHTPMPTSPVGPNYITGFWHEEFGEDWYKCVDAGSAIYMDYNFPNLLVSRDVGTFDPIEFSLKKIIYPTGGSTEYEYESNKYWDGLQAVRGGGLRVSKISSFDGQQNSLVKAYKYGIDENGAGNATFAPNSKHFSNTSIFLDYAIFAGSYLDYAGGRVREYSKNLLGDASMDIHFRITYPEVAVYDYVNNEPTAGKTTYSFSSDTPYEVRGDMYGPSVTGINEGTDDAGGAYIEYYRPWDEPVLNSVKIFKQTGVGYELLKTEEYEYSKILERAYTGVKVRQKVFTNYSAYKLPGAPFSPYSFVSSFFAYLPYSVSSGKNLLQKKYIRNYESGNVMVNEFDYTYNDQLLVASSKSNISNGEFLIEEYKYPSSYEDLTGTDDVTEGVKNLQNINSISTIVEKSVFKINLSNTKVLLSSEFNQYGSVFPIPVKQYNLEGDLPSLDLSTSSVAAGTISLNNRFKERYSINKIDSKGNILERRKINDVNEVYLWGYNSLFPVAKILNSNYDIAKTYISQSALDNPADEISLRNHLNNLRDIPGAIVSTYTYLPAIGMSSETDPNGRTTYYSYDDFGRLGLVRDFDGNIVRKFCYNYAGTPEVCTYYSSQQQSVTFYRNNCGLGYAGSAVTYTVPEGRYISSISLADANAKALAEISANGQQHANANGTCAPVTIYARMEYQNIYQDLDYATADLVLKFYSDEACAVPYSVTNLNVNYQRVRLNCGGWGSPSTINYTSSNSNGYQVNLGNVYLMMDDGIHCYEYNFNITNGTGYTAK